MASTFTTNTGIELIGTGEQSGTWGDTTNTNLQIIDRLTSGIGPIALSGTTHTLSTSDGALSDGHYAVLVFGGSPSGTNTVTISPNDQGKVFFVRNISGESVILTQGSGGDVTIADGKSSIVYADGEGSTAEVVDITATFVLPVEGDVVGPASSTDNAVALFDGTTGKLLKDSSAQDGFIHGLNIGRGASGVINNVVFGRDAGVALTTGSLSTLIGQGAGGNTTTGEENTCVGVQSGRFNETGDRNTAIGIRSFESLSVFGRTGSRNTAVGFQAMRFGASGDGNTAVGDDSAGNLLSGSNNTALGKNAGSVSSPFSITTESNRIVLGNDLVTDAYIRVAFTVTSDARDKTDVTPITAGLNLVEKLNPVTFKWDARSNYYVYDENGQIIDKPTPDGTHKENRLYVGFLAQEVQEAIEDVGFPEGIIIDLEQEDRLMLKETALIPVLVKAIQELKARVEALEAGANA